MGGRVRVFLILSLAALIAAGCAFPYPELPGTPTFPPPTVTIAPTTDASTSTSEPPPQPSPTLPPAIERVLIFSLDGLRADAPTIEGMPAVMALAAGGAASFSAQSVLPSSTLPSHGSILSGYVVERHGLTWNDYIPANGYIRTETVFTIAHAAGLRTVMVVGKEKLVHIAVPGSVDNFVYVPGGDFEIAAAAATEIAGGFDVLFVHFIGGDAAGHAYGWMSATYLATLTNTDEAVRRVLAALEQAGLRQTTLVILTADHGGHGTTHGSDLPEDTTIPWIVAGPNVLPGLTLSAPVRNLDTTPTALWALGLPIPTDMDGRVVTEAFSIP